MISIQVSAGDATGDKAVRNLKHKMNKELIFKTLKACQFHETGAEARVRQAKERAKRIKENKRANRLANS